MHLANILRATSHHMHGWECREARWPPLPRALFGPLLRPRFFTFGLGKMGLWFDAEFDADRIEDFFFYWCPLCPLCFCDAYRRRSARTASLQRILQLVICSGHIFSRAADQAICLPDRLIGLIGRRIKPHIWPVLFLIIVILIYNTIYYIE